MQIVFHDKDQIMFYCIFNIFCLPSSTLLSIIYSIMVPKQPDEQGPEHITSEDADIITKEYVQMRRERSWQNK